MGLIFKFIVAFVFLLLLGAHLVMLSFFLTPTPELLMEAMGTQANIVEAADIPEPVYQFMTQNKLQLEPDFKLAHSFKGQVAAGILEVRRNKLMEDTERMALDFNLIPFGEGVSGLEAAAQYYYRKPVSELTDAQWINLVNLHKIYVKQQK